jgi:HK97 family phage prohead protease
MDTLASPFEIKSISDQGALEGVAAGIGNVDAGGDVIMPGAFAGALAKRGTAPIPMLLYHDHKQAVGAWTDVRETSEGLTATGRIAIETKAGADAYQLVKQGAVRGLSVGYNTLRKTFAGNTRQLHEVNLHEISLVPIGMNDRALVRSVKSITSINALRELLQDAGFSGREAKAMAGVAWKVRADTHDDDHAAAELAAIIEQSVARIATI